MSYYNTVNHIGTDLIERKARTESQEQRVLKFFQENYNKSFTPFEVKQMALPNAPITSVRRCLTDLTNEDKLIKTSNFKKEKYGEKNHCWMLKPKTTLF